MPKFQHNYSTNMAHSSEEWQHRRQSYYTMPTNNNGSQYPAEVSYSSPNSRNNSRDQPDQPGQGCLPHSWWTGFPSKHSWWPWFPSKQSSALFGACLPHSKWAGFPSQHPGFPSQHPRSHTKGRPLPSHSHDGHCPWCVDNHDPSTSPCTLLRSWPCALLRP